MSQSTAAAAEKLRLTAFDKTRMARAGVASGVVTQSRGDGVGSGAMEIVECPPVTQNP
jgi:hypothetical protein